MDIFKSNIVFGIGAVFAAFIVAPVVLPVLANVGRPLFKAVVRGGMQVLERGREAVALAGESVEDMMAEIRAEEEAAAATAHAAAMPASGQAASHPASAPSPSQPEAWRADGKAQAGATEHS